MGKETISLAQFNRGLLSPLALARVDLKRLEFSAEVMFNWIARVFGSMMLRPGTQYLGSSRSDAPAKHLPFVFSTDDTAIVEITDSNLRVWVDDVLITRPSVTTAVTNGSFTTDVASWTDADEAGATSVWVTGGYLGLTGNGTANAIRRQQVTVSGTNIGAEHGLNIVIERGPVVFRCGSTSGGDEYITETTLYTGTHSLAVTPTGDFFVEFRNALKRQVLVDACTIESAGVMTVTSPFTSDDLDDIRYDQSGDVLFIAYSGQQRRIERRSERSWSVVKYYADDGPFLPINTGPITIAAAAISGNTTLTASQALFKSTHVGALFKLTSIGQTVTSDISAQNTFTNTINVTGTSTARSFTVSRTGVWVATVTLQRSFDDGVSWIDVTTYTTNASVTFTDGLDNQIILYRIGVKTGDYTSGTVSLTLAITTGSISGVARITAVSTALLASCEVITDFGSTSATDNWYEGEWSDYRGWPTSVQFVEGRLEWAGKNGVWLSVSDAFNSFDDETVGDSGPIARTIGSGPVDTINWSLSLQRLILGAEGAEFVVKSSSLDEPLTPTNFNVKPASTQGSAAVGAVKIDKVGVYVQRGGTRVMQIGYQEDQEYGSDDLTKLCPEVTAAGVVRMAVQRQPDTRIHCVLSDGTVAIAAFDIVEKVLCWMGYETDGYVEDVVILPGANFTSEDAVYYHVRRSINGNTKRYLERWPLESECVGGTLNKQADCFLIYSGVSTTTITGLSHLEGESVIVWGGGADLGTYTVTSGQITGLTSAVTSAVIGLSYTAQWKSIKLAYATGTALTQKKKISHLGVILHNTHAQGLKYGRDFDNLDDLPLKMDEAAVTTGTIHSHYDQEPFPFPGSWDSDARLCLQAQAPRPCTILAAIVAMEAHEKS